MTATAAPRLAMSPEVIALAAAPPTAALTTVMTGMTHYQFLSLKAALSNVIIVPAPCARLTCKRKRKRRVPLIAAPTCSSLESTRA